MKRVIIIGVLLALFCASAVLAADRMRIAYSSISGAYVGIWVAHDAGLFAKEGLDDQMILHSERNSTCPGDWSPATSTSRLSAAAR